MPKRYNESCTSVYIYKMNTQRTSLASIEDNLRESLKLNVVTKVGMDTEIIYDEGDTRPIRKDIILTLEAIITQNSNTEFADSWEYGNERPSDTARIQPANGNNVAPSSNDRGGNPINNAFVNTASMMTFFNEYLSTPGLVVDLAHYPSEVTSIVPSMSVSPIPGVANPTTKGYLTDSFNGPRPISISLKPIAGGNDFYLTWKVRFSVSTQISLNYANSTITNYDISSELRLDIDQDGDLQIIVAGTIYASNPYELYKAREELKIVMNPQSFKFVTDELTELTPQIPVDNTSQFTNLFAQVNGFHRSVVFNVEKSGRSAKFTVTYKQIKSNSAFPLGIKTMEFDHEISSSLFGENIFEGAGFTTWKSVFTGKMKIPHRFNANYAWFVIFYIIAQKTRKLSKYATTDKPPVSSDLADLFNDAKGELDPQKVLTNIKGLPTYLRLKHKHFSREVEFTIEYLVVAPLQYVIAATCLFERINNDYWKRYTLPRTDDGGLSPNYQPERLSQQWINWTQSVLVEGQFDPTSPSGVNLFPSGNLAFNDNAGTIILDGGHEINPFIPKGGIGLNNQRALFVTRVIDPNETDPDYGNNYNRFYPLPNPNGYAAPTSLIYIDPSNFDNSLRDQESQPYPTGISNNSVALAVPSETIDPRSSWVKFEESYELVSTHPTIPTESLTNVDYKSHSESELYESLINSAEYPSSAAPTGMASLPDPAAETRNVLASGMKKAISYSNVDNSDVVRKTYATKASRHFVTVRGFAIRVKYPIAFPTVISIAGAPAIKVGNGRSQIIPSGLSGTLPVYSAMWEQTYTVDADISEADILKSIESTGASIHYS